MTGVPAEPCGKPGGTQLTLLPWAVTALIVYVVGYPVALSSFFLLRRKLIMEDQLLRSRDVGDDVLTNPHALDIRKTFSRSYYAFKPDLFVSATPEAGAAPAVSSALALHAASRAQCPRRLPAHCEGTAPALPFCAVAVVIFHRPSAVVDHHHPVPQDGHLRDLRALLTEPALREYAPVGWRPHHAHAVNPGVTAERVACPLAVSCQLSTAFPATPLPPATPPLQQLAASLLVCFVGYAAQVRFTPYM